MSLSSLLLSLDHNRAVLGASAEKVDGRYMSLNS